MKLKQKVTINEIAATVGVSKTTISRYLNGRQDLMSKKTAERIKTVIELLDYKPSEFARGLKNNRSKIIGIVVADIESPFSASVIYGCGTYLRKNGYAPLFFTSNNSLEEEMDIVKLLVNKEIDGLIINTSSYHNKFLIEYSCRGLPIVLCDRYIKDYNLDIVTLDSDNAMLDLFRHLKEQGYNRPVMFTQEWENNSSRIHRISSFKKAMLQEYGYFHEDDIYVIDVNRPANAGERLREFLGRVKPNEIPVIVGVNTMTTMRMFNSLQQEGIKIPTQVGICGPDDWDWEDSVSWNELLYPSITTIKINAKEIGYQCARLMLERMENPEQETREIKTPCTLSLRNSTKRI